MNLSLKKILLFITICTMVISLNGCKSDQEREQAALEELESTLEDSNDFIEGYDADYVAPMDYGFENNPDMAKWIEITEYSLEEKTATYKEMGWQHCIYEFKNNVRYDYTRYEETYLVGQYELVRTNSYQILSNDSISLDNGKTYTILDRIVISDDIIVIKAFIHNTTKMFILEDQIDWEKSPIEENADEAYRSTFTYYFK